MTLTLDQIRLIQNHEPGWEQAWAELARDLLGNDGQSGRLCRVVRSITIRWPDEATRDDFIAWMMLKYSERAQIGTLLAGYCPEKGNPENYLSAPKILYQRALEFLAKIRARRELGNEQVLQTLSSPAYDPLDDRRFSHLAAAICEEQGTPTLRIDGKITGVVEQAGLQLYCRLKWDNPSLGRLRKHLAGAIRRPADEPDPFVVLARVHAAEQAHWKGEVDQICKRIYNDGKFVTLGKQEHLENQWIKVVFKLEFMPLRSPTVAHLLGVTLAAANMKIFNFKAKLPELICSIAEYCELDGDEGVAPTSA